MLSVHRLATMLRDPEQTFHSNLVRLGWLQ
jgi:hypothetical protein